jgi:hypothetical protein
LQSDCQPGKILYETLSQKYPSQKVLKMKALSSSPETYKKKTSPLIRDRFRGMLIRKHFPIETSLDESFPSSGLFSTFIFFSQPTLSES